MENLGKRPPQQPTAEELKLVYESLERGETNQRIFKLLAERRRDDPTHYYARSDDRFMQARRREYEAAKEVLWEKARQQVDPVFAQVRQRHFDYLTEITKGLLANRLDDVISVSNFDESGKEIITYVDATLDPSVDEHEDFNITSEELQQRLTENLRKANRKYGYIRLQEVFLPHILAEIPSIKADDLEPIIQHYTMEFLDKLQKLYLGAMFKGKCSICKEW